MTDLDFADRRLRELGATAEGGSDLAVAVSIGNQLRAELDRYQPATAWANATWWLHECGHAEPFGGGLQPEDGGCDACESGSPNAADWRRLYVRREA